MAENGLTITTKCKTMSDVDALARKKRRKKKVRAVRSGMAATTLPSSMTRGKGAAKRPSCVLIVLAAFGSSLLIVWIVLAAVALGSLDPSTVADGSAGDKDIDGGGTAGAPALRLRGPRRSQRRTEVNGQPWEGWQPAIPPTTCDTWRTCFKSVDHPACPVGCRDTAAEMGLEPPPVPPRDWIPDVTALRAMYLRGVDGSGRPWPPPLPDELCGNIGPTGGPNDPNRKLIDGVPIVAQPMDKSPPPGGEPYPKVMCSLYTTADKHPNRIRVIRETWAGGCDGFLAFSTKSDPRIPAISIPHEGGEAYENMWQKVRSIWRFIGEHYADDFDYFILGGDDMYILPQNLREYLATLQGGPEADHFVGRRLNSWGNYFNSGGPGYVLSRSTLKKFVRALDDKRCAPHARTSTEDVNIARCLSKVFGIHVVDTRDDKGRERFHPFAPGGHFTWKPPKPGEKRDWYYDYNKEWGVKLGVECCAPDSVSFHYIKKPAMMRHIHSLLYYCGNEKKKP